MGPASSQPARAQPGVDAIRDGGPTILEHHVVAHAGEEFCFGVVRSCGFAHLRGGVSAVFSRTKDEQRSCHVLELDQVEERRVEIERTRALFLQPSRCVRDYLSMPGR